MPTITLVKDSRSFSVIVRLDREYQIANEIKILQDAIRELQKEVIRLKNLAF